jgi:hypothetical protein
VPDGLAMDKHIILHCILIIGFALCALIPLDRTHNRGRWANRVFLICAVLGIVKEVADIAWEMHRLEFGERTYIVLNSSSGGFILGLIFALVLSGQLFGTRQNEGMKQPPQ